MLDYLDSILSQSAEATPLLRPRTPALFESVPSGYGPDDRFGPSLGFHATSPQERFVEETETPTHATESPRNTVQTVHEIASKKESNAGVHHLPEKIQSQSGSLSRSELKANAFPGEPLLKPASSVAIPARLNELEAMTQKARSASLSSPIEQASTPNHLLQPPSIANPVAMSDVTARLVPHLSALTHPVAAQERSELPKLRDSNELPEGVFFQKRKVDALKQMDEKLETLRPKPVDSPVTHSVRAPSLSANLYSQPEQGRSMPNVVPLQIHVNIRQVEVRAAAAPPPARPQARRGATPTSLDDYLQRMNGGSR